MMLKDANGVSTDWIRLSIETGGSQKGQPYKDNLFFMAQLLREFREISQKYSSTFIYNLIQKNKKGWIRIEKDEENKKYILSDKGMLVVKDKIECISEIFRILMSKGDINSLKMLVKTQEEFINSMKNELFHI